MITVRELIEKLAALPPDAIVLISDNGPPYTFAEYADVCASPGFNIGGDRIAVTIT